MLDFIIEAVLVSFGVGGVVGAVVTMHLMHPKKAAEKKAEEIFEP